MLFDKLNRHSLYYSFSKALTGLPGIIFLPWFTHHLSRADMGILVSAWLGIDLLQAMSELGMRQALIRFFPMARSQEERKTIIATAFITIFAGVFLVVMLALITRKLMPGFIFPSLGTAAFIMLVLASSAVSLRAIPMVYYRAEQKAGAFVVFHIALMLMECTLLGLALYQGILNIFLILAIKASSHFACFILSLGGMGKDLSLTLSILTLKKMLHYGVWLMPAGIFVWVAYSIDRFWLIQLVGLEAGGTYGAFYKFITPLVLLFSGYIMSLDSQLFKQEQKDAPIFLAQSLVRFTRYSSLLSLSASIILSLGLYYAVKIWHLFPPKYLPGLNIVPLIILTHYINTYGDHYGSGLEYGLKSKLLFKVLAILASCNFILTALFVFVSIKLGLDYFIAASASTAISFYILYILQKRQMPLKLPARTELIFHTTCLALIINSICLKALI